MIHGLLVYATPDSMAFVVEVLPNSPFYPQKESRQNIQVLRCRHILLFSYFVLDLLPAMIIRACVNRRSLSRTVCPTKCPTSWANMTSICLGL